jgi:hypothetical protein
MTREHGEQDRENLLVHPRTETQPEPISKIDLNPPAMRRSASTTLDDLDTKKSRHALAPWP